MTLSRWDEKRYDVDSVWQRSIRRFVYFIKSSKNFVKYVAFSAEYGYASCSEQDTTEFYEYSQNLTSRKQRDGQFQIRKKLFAARSIILKPASVYAESVLVNLLRSPGIDS